MPDLKWFSSYTILQFLIIEFLDLDPELDLDPDPH
jgi:hypothetical protein